MPRERLEVPPISPLERKLVVTPDGAKKTRPNITPIESSGVLDRVRGFLPQMAAANNKLEQEMQIRPASDFDIESLPNGELGPYIEMDLACGLFDLKDEASVQHAERAMAAGPTPAATDLPLSDSGSETDCSSDDDMDDGRAAVTAAASSAQQDDVGGTGTRCAGGAGTAGQRDGQPAAAAGQRGASVGRAGLVVELPAAVDGDARRLGRRRQAKAVRHGNIVELN